MESKVPSVISDGVSNYFSSEKLRDESLMYEVRLVHPLERPNPRGFTYRGEASRVPANEAHYCESVQPGFKSQQRLMDAMDKYASWYTVDYWWSAKRSSCNLILVTDLEGDWFGVNKVLARHEVQYIADTLKFLVLEIEKCLPGN